MRAKEKDSNLSTESQLDEGFFHLSPDHILDAVEAVLPDSFEGRRATGRVIPLNSIENRVIDIELDGQQRVVAKFYRPGRWNAAQIAEEHRVLRLLHEAGVSVVTPLELKNSPGCPLFQDPLDPQAPSTLATSTKGLLFTLFPRFAGRLHDELNEEQTRRVGRALARLHNAAEGSRLRSSVRPSLSLASFGDESLQTLLEGNWLESPLGERYATLAEDLLDHLEVIFEGTTVHRIHGDCHLGNVLWMSEEPTFVDFDDTLVGPAVQDIWMLFRGDDARSLQDRETFLSAYEELRSFDRSSLDLIEPLRALRLMRYSAWIAQRWKDPSFPHMFPTFGTDAWWQSEIEALLRVQEAIEPNS